MKNPTSRIHIPTAEQTKCKCKSHKLWCLRGILFHKTHLARNSYHEVNNCIRFWLRLLDYNLVVQFLSVFQSTGTFMKVQFLRNQSIITRKYITYTTKVLPR